MRSGIICAAICLSMAAFGQATQTTVTEYRTITTTFYDHGHYEETRPTNTHERDNGGPTDIAEPAPRPTERAEDGPTPPQAPKGDPRPPADEIARGPEEPDVDPRPPADEIARGPEAPNVDPRPPADEIARGPEGPNVDPRPPADERPRAPDAPKGDPRPPMEERPTGPELPKNGDHPPPPFNNSDEKSNAPEPSKSGEHLPQESPNNGKPQSIIHTATPPINNKANPSASASGSSAGSNVATDFVFSPITLAPESSQSNRPTSLRELTASNGATDIVSSNESHAVGDQYILSFATVAGMTMVGVLASTLVQL